MSEAVQFLMALTLSILTDQSNCHQLPDIYWNSSNALFFEKHQASMEAHIGDKLSIFCPYYPSLKNDKLLLVEDAYLEIYRHGFDRCTLRYGGGVVGVCTTPSLVTELILVLREITANPSGLEYKPGQRYYFISATNGSRHADADLCRWNNMKMTLDVLALSSSTTSHPINGPKNDEYFLITYHTPSENRPRSFEKSANDMSMEDFGISYIVHTGTPEPQSKADAARFNGRRLIVIWSLLIAYIVR